MRSKPFLVLAVLTVLALAAAAASIVERQNANRLPDVPAALFPGLMDRVNDVATVDVATPAGAFTIRRDGELWQAVEKSGYPVKFETVKQAVVGMASLKPLEPRTQDAGLYHRLQLVDPRDAKATEGKGVLIELKDAAGKQIAAVIVGKTKSVSTTAREGWYYVREPEERRTWLASGRIDVFERPTAWLDSSMIEINRNRVRSATSIQPDGTALTVGRPNNTKVDFAVENVPQGYRQTFDTAPNSLGAALGFLSFEDVKPAGEVDFAGANKAVFKTFDGLVVTGLVKRLGEEEFWIRFEAAHDPAGDVSATLGEEERAKLSKPEDVAKEVAHIQARFAPWAYRVPKYKAEDFMAGKERFLIEITPEEAAKAAGQSGGPSGAKQE